MQTEIAAAEKVVRREEDRLLERMEEAETLAAELKAAEAALKTGQAEVMPQPPADGRRARTATERSSTRPPPSARSVAAGVSAGAPWRSSSASRSTARAWRCPKRATASARSATSGCGPQVYNELRRNESVMQCESCSRILYFVAPAARSRDADPTSAPAEPGNVSHRTPPRLPLSPRPDHPDHPSRLVAVRHGTSERRRRASSCTARRRECCRA